MHHGIHLLHRAADCGSVADISANILDAEFACPFRRLRKIENARFHSVVLKTSRKMGPQKSGASRDQDPFQRHATSTPPHCGPRPPDNHSIRPSPN